MSEKAVENKTVLKKLNNFFNKFNFLKFKTGRIIMVPGDPLNSVYYIKTGDVRIYSINEKGDELTFYIASPGTYFPMSILVDEQARYFYETLTEVEAYQAPREKAIEFFKDNPEEMVDMVIRFSSRLKDLMSRVEDLFYDSAYIKVASLMNYFAIRFGQKEGKDILISVPLTHALIASLLGIKRETTSRQIEKLQSKGIISYKNHFLIIHDSHKLNKESVTINREFPEGVCCNIEGFCTMENCYMACCKKGVSHNHRNCNCAQV